MIDVKKTSVKIPVDNLIKLKEIAVRKGTTQNSVINEFISEGIEKENFKAPLINDRLLELEGEGENLEDLAGFIKIDDPENLDVNELIDSIHFKKELYIK